MSAKIYTGFWVNWAQGPIYGATLTLSQRNGVLLLAAAATFVTFLSSKLWRIFVFTVHQCRASKVPRDGLFHQQQAILRNSGTAGGAAWSFLLQSFFWSGKADYAAVRTWSWATISLCYLLLTAAAALYSSDISKAVGDVRLLQAQDCGLWDMSNSSTSLPVLQSVFQKTATDNLLAKAYANRCYSSTSDSAACVTFPQRSLAWTATQNAKCPFNSSICGNYTQSSYQMTSAVLNSFLDFGINTPPDQRIDLQKVTTCAPVKTEGYVFSANATDKDIGVTANDKFLNCYYGRIADITDSSKTSSNYTYRYNKHNAAISNDYTIKVQTAFGGNPGGSTWKPIAALRRSDADVTIVFISSNGIYYIDRCDDPIFSARRNLSVGAGVTLYASDRYVNVLGCAEQYQLCNPTNNVCTPLTASFALNTEAVLQPLQLSEMQRVIYNRMLRAAMRSDIYLQLAQSHGVLEAQETLFEMFQVALPKDQWQLETSKWYQYGLARMQFEIQEYVTGGTPYTAGFKFTRAQGNATMENLCRNQMVRDSQSTISFSVLGLAVLAVTGLLILVLNYTLEPVVGWIQRKYHHREYAYFNWLLDDVLQLQRMAYQAQGWGTWTKSHTAVPTTLKGEKFGGWGQVHDRHEWIAPTPRSSMSIDSRSEINLDKVSNAEGRKSMDILVAPAPSSVYSNWQQPPQHSSYEPISYDPTSYHRYDPTQQHRY